MGTAPGRTEEKRSGAPLRRGGVPQKIYWEGINLNKISKKIVSLVTMAAFALTLVPTAVFAASGDLYPQNSSYTVESSQAGELKVQLNLQDDQTPAGTTTIPTNALVKITVDGADKNTTVAGNNIGELDVNTLAEKGYKPNAADEIFTFSNLPTGAHKVTVEVTPDSTASPVQWTTLYGYKADADATNVDVSNQETPVVSVTGITNPAASRIIINGSTADVTASLNSEDEATKTVQIALQNGTALASGDAVYLWAEDANKNVVDVFDVTSNATVANGNAKVWKITDPSKTADVQFTVAGDYVLYAGIANDDTLKAGTVVDTIFAGNPVDLFSNSIKVTVTPATVVTEKIAVTSVDEFEAKNATPAKAADGSYTYEYRLKDEVSPSDTKEYTVTGKAWTEDNLAAEGEKILVTVDKGVTVLGLDEETNTYVTTDANGNFKFKVRLAEDGEYTVTLREANGEATTYLVLTEGNVNAASIEKVSDGGYVLAGTDIDYAADVYATGKLPAYFSDAVQFAITDVYGRNAVGQGVLADEYAADTTTANAAKHEDAVNILNKGANSTLTAADIALAWDEDAGVYTLAYVNGDGDSYASDLTPGEYSIRVALNNGGRNAVTVNFTVAEFGEVQDLVLDMTARPAGTWDSDANNDNAIEAIDDTVALGQKVTVTPKYVDENGLKVKLTSLRGINVGINGDAVAKSNTTGSIWFTTQDNIAANNSLVGTVVTVKVNDQNTGIYVEKELTVVKNYLNETLSVDPVQGVVGEPNTVNVTVVDEDGNISKVNGKLSATLVSQSDETADVNIRVNPDVKDGKASLYLESDKAGTADVRVVVTAANGELYGTTFTYTFGDEDPYAGRTVVMTIGSADYIINNKVVEGDAAPYIDSAWRTMVPVRVLAESFGADVDYTDGVVTIVDGDTTIVMNVGEDTYTINDEEQTMDTAPVIGAGDRTYVPVRFVAEGLGYEVTPLYDVENGTTASVAFQK